jgi:hypothetical protein
MQVGQLCFNLDQLVRAGLGRLCQQGIGDAAALVVGFLRGEQDEKKTRGKGVDNGAAHDAHNACLRADITIRQPTHLVVLQLFALLIKLVESGVDALEERLRLLPLLFSFLKQGDTLTAPLLVDPGFGSGEPSA